MPAILKLTQLRLSRRDYQLLDLGWKPIATGIAEAKEFGQTRNADYIRIFQPWRGVPSRFDDSLLQILLQTHEKLTSTFECSPCETHRVQLNVFQLMILQWIARVGKRQVSHGHAEATVKNYRRACKILLKKLERARKRAKRSFLTCFGLGSYRSWLGRWKAFRTWLGQRFLCLCRERRVNGLLRVRKALVNDSLRVAKDILRAEKVDAPDDKQLRKLVRLAIRGSRRGRLPFSVIDLARGKDSARVVLSHFLTHGLEAVVARSFSGRFGFSQ